MSRSKLILSIIIVFTLQAGVLSDLIAQKVTMQFMVSLTDKDSTPFLTTHPEAFLSERAIERRTRFGIPVTEQDLPVYPGYLDSLQNNGVKVLSASKWFNAALVEVNDSADAMNLLNLPFVNSVDLLYIKDSTKQGRITQTNKMLYEIDPAMLSLLKNRTAKNEKGASGLINYGYSFAQVNMLGANYLHQIGYTGDSIVIAVLDAGFSMTDFLPVFDSLRYHNRILSTRNFVTPGETVYGSSQHGTMVLSTMGGNLPGVIVGTAPHATYHLLLSEDVTSEFPVEEFYWCLAAEYADSIGADMINSSLGYTTYDHPALSHTYASMDGKTTLSARAATIASSRGMLVSASAGNGGGGSWHYISSPGDADSILTVGAVDVSGQYASFSSTGPSFDGRVKPDVAAVGFGATISASGGGATFGNGTSFSSPIMCGAVACLWQANPNMSNLEIIESVRKSAHQFTFPDTLLGYGIPNLAVAHLLLGGQKFPDISEEKEIKIAPNPFYDYMLVTFYATDTQNVLVELYDMRGMLYHSRSVKKSTGLNVINLGDLNRLTSGAYILKIVDGSNVITKKVIRR